MVATGSLGLVPIAAVLRESANPVELGLWQLVAAYGAVLLLGLRVALRSAHALALGSGFLVGPILGATAFTLGSATGCLVNALVADVSEARDRWWDHCGEPLVTLLVIGVLPALLVGGVFSAVLSPWLPRRSPPPKRP